MNQRIYIVGAGAIACHHAQAIAHFAESEYDRPSVCVTDVNQATLADFVKKFPWATPFDDLVSMLGEPARADDVVIVATPPSTHAEISCLALRSGRHVLCEKPLAMNKEEASLIRHGKLDRSTSARQS
jgi:predicted dehydrogenase